MKPYLSLFRMRVTAGLQYRAAAWAGVAAQFFFGFMYIMIYRAFYMSGESAPPMEWAQLVSYTWLQQAFLAIIALWSLDGELLSGITEGHVAYELCRPYNLFMFWLARLVALRLSNVMLRCVPILLIAGLIPGDIRMGLPADAAAAGMFLLSLCLALFLVTAISMFIYILTFVTLSPMGARLIVGVAAEFLQGSVIPVPLMPEGLQKVLNFFPFRYAADLPFRLYSGNIAGTEALLQIGIQLLWIVALLLLGSMAFRRVLSRVVIQGG